MSMEFGEWEDTNDSWIWDVDDLQYDEKGESGEKEESGEWGDTNDSWIWDVDDLQYGYGEKKRKTSDDNDDVSTSDSTTEEDVASTSNSFYTINQVRQVKAKKFHTTAVDYSVCFNDLQDLDLIREYERTQQIFEQLLSDVTQGMQESDLVRFVLRTEQLDRPISLPFMPLSRLTPERVFSQIERVVQSKQDFHLNESVIVNIVHVGIPNGSGKRKRDNIDLESYLRNKRSIISIKNKDDLCLARALVVAIANIDKDRRYKLLVDSRRQAQENDAWELHRKAGVPIGPCGISEVKQFQKYLTEYEINIVSMEHGNTIIYPEQPIVTKTKRIYLYLHNNHYDVITTMPGFLNRSYFCHMCRKSYDSTVDHSCDSMCKMCRGFECSFVDTRSCVDCKRTFKSQACYDRHKEPLGKGQSVCQQVKKCMKCAKSMRIHMLANHLCGKTKCKTCEEFVDVDGKDTHYCYMKRPKESETEESETEGSKTEESGYDQLMFFDYECRQEDGIHEPNLCIVHNEMGDEWIFRGENTNLDFCKWLFVKDHQNCVFVAHNFQGYDGYFIQNYLNKNGVEYKVIMSGAKIMTLTVPMFNIKFIDSLNFIPMSLAKFPKTFGLDELRKGYFPHLFNKKENESYVGPIPPEPYYLPNQMSSKDREAFQKWHKEQRENNYVFDFDFAKEITEYCASDVDILRRSCMEFRELFRNITGIDPFEKCLTIASACQMVYRTNFLKENTIAIFNSDRHLKMKQSNMALKWLSFVSEKEGICIKHVRNGGEKRVGKYSLDGYHQESNTAYEFQGCLWHGK